MTQERIFSDSGRELERLSRQGSNQIREISVVSSPGSKSLVFAAKIKGLASYNIYNISMVELNNPGSEPAEAGSQMQAVNLAEPFTAEGQLATGTFVLVCRAGEKNIFYAQV